MNVRFFGGYKSEYVSIPKHNPIGLYFCADTRELFLGDKLLSDGLRVVATFADLPSISEHKAAEGVIYFVADTKNGYVLPRGGSDWLQVIYAPTSGEGAETDLSNYYTKAEVDEAILKAIANIEIEVDLSKYATKAEVAAVEAKIPTNYLKEIPAEYVTEEELNTAITDLATKTFVTDEINKIEIPEAYDDSEIRELLNAKAASEHTHNEYALTEHTHDEYLTEQSLEGYAKTSELFSKDYNELTNKPAIPSIEGLATEKYVDEAVAGITIPKVPDVSNFITMEDVEAKGYIAEVPAEYVTESELDGKGYLTEQNLEAYAKKNELFSKSYNDLTDKPEIPSIEGLATEQFVTDEIAKITIPEVDTSKLVTTETLAEALTEKADKVLFTTAKFVNNPIGGFTKGEPIKGLTIAELFAKLLGLSDDKPGTDEPEEPEIPDEPNGIIETILYNKTPMFQIDENDKIVEVPYELLMYPVDSVATTRDGKTGFYKVEDENGKIIEAGYQHYSTAKDPYYIVALPEDLIVATDGNTEMQSWNTMVQPNRWTEVGVYTLTGDYDEIVATYNADGIEPPVAPAGYRLWADLNRSDPGSALRFVIKE